MSTAAELEAIKKHYASIYPDWQDLIITRAETLLGGKMAAIRANENGMVREELCFVYPDGTVRVFFATEELLEFLKARANVSPFERLFARPMISGVVFFLLTVLLSVLVFFEKPNAQVITALGSAFGLAAGFFFGEAKKE